MFKEIRSTFGELEKITLHNEETGNGISLVPEAGGILTELLLNNKNVLLPFSSPEELVNNPAFKNALLFPFPNRLENGSYSLFDQTVTGHKPGTPSDDGYFKFCAPPGTYYVEVVMPPLGLVQALPNVINNISLGNINEPTNDSDLTNAFGQGTTPAFTVESMQTINTIGAGFYPMATVGNSVWHDQNLNGIQDGGEAKLGGVTVEAYTVQGELINSTTTDSNGNYKIDYLGKEGHYFKFIPPAGFTFTSANVGPDDLDSDVDYSNGAYTTGTIMLEPNQQVEHVDAGFVQGLLPVTWVDLNAIRIDEQTNNVYWSTQDEINNSHFIVERRLSGKKDFTAIGEVDSKGNNLNSMQSYEYVDNYASQSGRYYYRIKQVDIDGRFEYSKVVSLEVREGRSLHIYPSPTTGLLSLELNVESRSAVSVDLFASDGSLVESNMINTIIDEGFNLVRLDLSDKRSGVYRMRININGKAEYRDIIVVK